MYNPVRTKNDNNMFRHHRSLKSAFVLVALAMISSVFATAGSVQVAVNTAFIVDSSGLGATCAVTAGSGGTAYYDCLAPDVGANVPTPQNHFIANDPEIQFADNGLSRCNLAGAAANPNIPGTIGRNVCNSQLLLCAQVSVNQDAAPASLALDKVSFEVFRYIDGSNPLDPASTPPLRTMFIDSAGSVSGPGFLPSSGHAYCVMWDGSQSIQGSLGKINGQYGFRVAVETNQQGASGQIVITAVRAYPSGGVTYDGSGGPPYTAVAPKAITVNVNDVHVVRSTPTIVGQITGVAAEPYNFTYRLSKGATMYLNVSQSNPPYSLIRTVVPALQRTGEGDLGTQNAVPIVNGDSWDGRDSNGNFMPAGNYLASFQSNSMTLYSNTLVQGDLSAPTTVQIGLDPLQITDIRVQPLLGGATSLAVLSYMLTEPATVYIEVYSPGTQFCNDSNNIAALNDLPTSAIPGVNYLSASSGGCIPGGGAVAPVQPLRSIVQQQTFRTPILSYWDGRDSSGNLVGDGDYVFVIYATLPSQRGAIFDGNAADRRIWTTQGKIGFISVLRGLVGLTQVTPTTTVIGSSPAISGLNPFSFRYQLSRDATVSLKIFDATGSILIKTIVDRETRPGFFNNVEPWVDGTGNDGRALSSGTYLVQLTAYDPAFPARISTTTALFPINMYRITDVSIVPLLAGASDQVVLSYQLSQPMFVAWNVYPPGSIVVNSTGAWPPCVGQSPPSACTSASVVNPSGIPVSPVVTFHGMRPGRLRISEFWDGRDTNGLFVPDGNYVFTLVAQTTTTPQYYTSDHIFGTITVARGSIIFLNFSVTPDVPVLFNSSNTITLHPYTISYTLSRQSSVTIQILNTTLPAAVVRTLVSGSVREGSILQTDIWDGRDDRGNFLPAGFYLVRAVASDVASALTSGTTAQAAISYDPLRIYDLAVTPITFGGGGAIIAYQVSESMKVSIKIYKPGTTFDSAGTPSQPDSVSLVRRIVGIRPGRTLIQDVWDGRDFRMALVPDGVYRFKIVGSTDPTAIDSITGNILNPAVLATDRPIDDIPVATDGAAGDAGTNFDHDTFVYPNPVTGNSAVVKIFMPYTGRAIFNLYTIAGQLVYSRTMEGMSANHLCSGDCNSFTWNKVNASGRTLARGLYYAVIRVEETQGSGTVYQTVKKVLIP